MSSSQSCWSSVDGAQPTGILAVEDDLAPGQAAPAGDGIDERGFSGAVGADQPANLGFLQGQRNTVEGLGAAVMDGHILGLQHIGRHTDSLRTPGPWRKRM